MSSSQWQTYTVQGINQANAGELTNGTPAVGVTHTARQTAWKPEQFNHVDSYNACRWIGVHVQGFPHQ